jgi:hypothetical protein
MGINAAHPRRASRLGDRQAGTIRLHDVIRLCRLKD